jgi:hypothetical protein
MSNFAKLSVAESSRGEQNRLRKVLTESDHEAGQPNLGLDGPLT